MNWHILLNFTFHLQQKCSGMFVYYEYLKHYILKSFLTKIFLPQNPENVRPHPSNSLENVTPW